MPKRPRPWENDFERQSKTYLPEKKVYGQFADHMSSIYKRTNDLLFEGARRISRELNEKSTKMETGSPATVGFFSNESPQITDSDMEIEQNSNMALGSDSPPSPVTPVTEFDLIKNIHPSTERKSRVQEIGYNGREPSPVPSATELVKTFMFATRNIHGPYEEEDKKYMLHQSTKYRQLHLEDFLDNNRHNTLTGMFPKQEDQNGNTYHPFQL